MSSASENDLPNSDLGALEEIQAPEIPADLESEVKKDARKELISYESEYLKLQNQSLAQDIEERRKYANKIYQLLCIWLISIFTLLVFQGFSAKSSPVKIILKNTPESIKSFDFDPKFHLSDKVLLALIGGTTINVIGIFIIVANYLFPNYAKQNNNVLLEDESSKDKIECIPVMQ